MKNSYFIIDGIKCVVTSNNGNTLILKELNNQLLPLNDKEKKLISKLYQYDERSIIKNTILEQLYINNNGSLNGKSTQEIIRFIERMIPEDCRDNFYRNLKTLDYSLDDTFDGVFDNNTNSNNWTGGEAGYYDYEKNLIHIDNSCLKKILDTSEKDSNIDFLTEYRSLLFHEMMHVASTKYDSENNTKCSGFDDLNSKERNVGINEGFTDLITRIYLPSVYTSGYLIESYIALQLSAIIGEKEMLSAYFSASGIDTLKDKLTECGIDIETASVLFKNIELNFLIGRNNLDCKTSLLADIQTVLLQCMLNKNKKEMNEGIITNSEFTNNLDNYGKILITSEFLEKKNRNSSNYDGLDELVILYNSIKKGYNVRSNFEIEKMTREVKNDMQENIEIAK